MSSIPYLFAIIMGVFLIGLGVLQFKINKAFSRVGLVLILLGLLSWAYLPFDFWQESLHTHTDAEGTYYDHN